MYSTMSTCKEFIFATTKNYPLVYLVQHSLIAKTYSMSEQFNCKTPDSSENARKITWVYTHIYLYTKTMRLTYGHLLLPGIRREKRLY